MQRCVDQSFDFNGDRCVDSVVPKDGRVRSKGGYKWAAIRVRGGERRVRALCFKNAGPRLYRCFEPVYDCPFEYFEKWDVQVRDAHFVRVTEIISILKRALEADQCPSVDNCCRQDASPPTRGLNVTKRNVGFYVTSARERNLIIPMPRQVHRQVKRWNFDGAGAGMCTLHRHCIVVPNRCHAETLDQCSFEDRQIRKGQFTLIDAVITPLERVRCGVRRFARRIERIRVGRVERRAAVNVEIDNNVSS